MTEYENLDKKTLNLIGLQIQVVYPMVNCQGSYYSVSYVPTALKICHDSVHQKLAKQHTSQNYCNSNSYEEKYHLLILVIVKNSQPRQARTPARRYSQMANNIEIWENLRNNFCCKKYREPTRCSTKDSQAMISYK